MNQNVVETKKPITLMAMIDVCIGASQPLPRCQMMRFLWQGDQPTDSCCDVIIKQHGGWPGAFQISDPEKLAADNPD